MRTYKDVLEDGIQLLETAAIEEARLDAWLLLEYTADITRAWYYAHMDDGLDAKTEERYRTLNVYLYRDRIQRCLWKKRFLA